MTLWLDLETTSTVDIDAGGHVYAACAKVVLGAAAAPPPDPTLWVWTVCKGVDVDAVAAAWREATGAPVRVVLDEETAAPPPDLLARAAGGVVAHNAEGFDRCVWEAQGWPVVPWLDALPRARRLVLPGALDALGERVLGRGKDPAGSRLLNLLRRHKDPASMEPEHATALACYCVRDVALLASLWLHLDLGAPHVDDAVLEASDAVNRRGVLVDTEAVDRLLRIRADLDLDALLSAEEHAPPDVRRAGLPVVMTWLRSPAQLGAWFCGRGFMLPDVTAPTLKALLGEAPATPEVEDVLNEAPPVGDVERVVIEARLAVARVSGGKLRKLRTWSSVDGRVRGSLAYHRAHTGRWAGRGPQLQNLPRLPEKLESVGVEDLVAATVRAVARAERVRPAAVVGALTRRCLVAPPGLVLVAVDYGQIEARGLCLLAGDGPGLDVFRRWDAGAGADPYRVLASSLFGVAEPDVTPAQRQTGKLGCLACGYAGGRNAVLRISGGRMPIDGLDPQAVVDAFRDAHPAIAGARTGGQWGRSNKQRTGGWWNALMQGWNDALSGAATGPWRLDPAGASVRPGLEGRPDRVSPGDVVYTLPSGRELRYRESALELRPSRWREGDALEPTYVTPGGARVGLYGGRLSENCVQAYCRDLLAAALVRLEAAGERVVLTVHDEVVVESTPGRAEEIAALVRRVPAWAAGLPIAVDVSEGPRYG